MKEVVIIVLSIVSFIFSVWFFVFDGDEYIASAILRTEINRANQYYTDLHDECLQGESESCCLSSVDAMETGGYELMPKAGCEKGFAQNMLRCINGFAWCEPTVGDESTENKQDN